MAMVIWLNGAFVEGDAARVSALDAGLQHGVGLFETMQARHGRVFRLSDHLDRLAESAAELGLADPLRVEPLAQAVEQVMAKWARPDARVRLTLTGGVVNMLREARDGKPVALLVPLGRQALSAEVLVERWARLPAMDPVLLRRDVDALADTSL